MDKQSFSEKSFEVFNKSEEMAKLLNCKYIGSEMLIIGIISVSDCHAKTILNRFNVDCDRYCEEFKTLIDPDYDLGFNLTDRAKHVLENSVKVAEDCGKKRADTEHILYCI